MNHIVVISLQSLTATSAAGGGKLTYYLARHLNEIGKLNKLIVSSKGKFTTSFPCRPVSLLSRYYLLLLNGLLKMGFVKYYRKRFIEEWLFDFFLQFQIDRTCRLLVSINPYLPRTLRKCKRLGIKTCLIPTTPEENEINRLLSEERKRWSVKNYEMDAYSYEPRLSVYNESVEMFDRIVAYTSVIGKTFSERHSVDKIISCLGLSWAIPPTKVLDSPVSARFKVVYLAHTVLLKGLQDLLQSWSIIDTDRAELHIGGNIDPVVLNIIRERFQGVNNVFYHDHISDIQGFLKDASLLVCPSIIDAGPATVLEAASCGIPSVMTEKCGAVDVFENNISAFIIPTSDPESLALVLSRCMNSLSDLKIVGQEATKAIERQRLADFILRLTETIGG